MLWWTLRQLKSRDAAARKRADEKLGESRELPALDSLVAALEDKEPTREAEPRWRIACRKQRKDLPFRGK